MTYKVSITPAAVRDLTDFVDYVARVRNEPNAAITWLEAAIAAASALGAFPRSSPLIPEKDEFDVELRHTIYHSHRIVFEVRDNEATVYIHRFHHAARRVLKLEE